MQLTIDAIKARTFDAIVVGSGISGGWAAKELTEKGLRVLMLDRGHHLEHVTGYETAMTNPWEFAHRLRLTQEQRETHPYLSRDYPYGEDNASFWFDDLDAPYEEKNRFDWFRPNILGGKSLLWGRQSYRLSDLDFEANARDGHGTDWPIRYKDLAPWYSYVEKFAGISGEKLGLAQLPDSEFLPPMDMNCVEKHTQQQLKTKMNRVMTIGRVANLTTPTALQTSVGRAPCQYRHQCRRGCPYGGYFSTLSATLPAARKTNRLTVKTDAIVREVLYDAQKQKATGVRVIDSKTGAVTEYYSRIVFVNASAIGSLFVLLNSTSDRFPNGLGNDNDILGRYVMDHQFKVGASGNANGLGFNDMYYTGRRANGIYVPRFRNLGTEKRAYVRGFGYQGGGSRSGWQRLIAEEGFGADWKDKGTTPGPWSMGLTGFGECLPYPDNRVTLNRQKTDKWGLPTVAFDVKFRENERLMRKEMATDAAEMLEAAGMKNVRIRDEGSFPGMAIHEMGGCRMGRDPKTSMLNANNQLHAVTNVFVTDGASMASSSCVNPSLTYMALTARAADFAVKEMKRQNL